LIEAFLIMIEYYKNFSLENLFYINEKGLVCSEEWRDIPNWIGFYQGSNLGRLKSLDREIVYSNGGVRIVKGVVLRQAFVDKYLQISLYKNQKSISYMVHQLIFSAFNGFYPKRISGKLIDHINTKQKTNNCIWNLQLITYRGNSFKDNQNKLGQGVSTKGKSFTSRIFFNGKYINKGMFKTKEEAHAYYLFLYEKAENGEDISIYEEEKRPIVNNEMYIYFEKNKYAVRVKINGKNKRFGSYNTLKEAIIVRDRVLATGA